MEDVITINRRLTDRFGSSKGTLDSRRNAVTYSGDGLRQSSTTGGTTTDYTWDINRSLPEVLSDGTSQYIYGLGGTPLAQVSATGTVYKLADGLGSTMATTDASGNVVNTYAYDPYGATTSSTGSQPNPFQFAGQATDSAGLQYLRARYYDPATGTFLSSDPMGVSPSWPGQPYGYGGDNPVLNADPLGLVCFLSVCADRDGVSVGGHEAANGATAVGTVAVGTALTAGRIAQGCVLDVPMCWSATEDALVATATFDLGFVAIGSTCAAGLLTGPGAIAFCALGIGTVAVPFFAAGGTLGVIAGKEFWDLGEKQS